MKRWTHQPKVGDVIDPLGKWVLYDDMERHAASEYARGYANGSGDEGRYQREIERLRAAQQHMYVEGKRFEGLWRDAAQALERIEQERLTWAMACECYCPACTALDKLIRGHLPQSEGTK